jgi:pimeloyl-ACP methyl ester carboxylesterase
LAFALASSSSFADRELESDAVLTGDTVVMLHGLGRSSWSMWLLQRRFEKAGLRVENIGYPSRSRSIDELAEFLQHRLSDRDVAGDGRLHFVTHSMGGIVARAFIRNYRPQDLGRVVMLCPPNRGSEIVDFFADNWFFRTLAGPAATDLGTGSDSAPSRLGPADFELGVIMGSRSWNPIGSWILPGNDDGTVSEASAKLEGMRDFVLVSSSHTFIMADRDVSERALHFLRYGRFPGLSEDEPAADEIGKS